MHGADLVAYAAVGPRLAGPIAVEVSGANQDRVGVGVVGEPAAETGVHADMYKHSAGVQHPTDLMQRLRVVGNIGVDHDGDDSADGARPDRKPLRVGLNDGQSTIGVTQHSGGNVHAN